MVPFNVFSRVLHLSAGNFTGTGFLVHVNQREYLVTARHLAEQFSVLGMEIFHQGSWLSRPFTLVGHSEQSDISVLALAYTVCPAEMTVQLTVEGLTYGQDLYFFGFPFGISGDAGELLSDGFPMPFVKRAILSGVEGSLRTEFWLDGINNQGFSGGPVVWGNVNDPNNYRICGVICGYYEYNEEILLDGRPTGYVTPMNSGLIKVASILTVLEIIYSNPIGPSLNQGD